MYICVCIYACMCNVCMNDVGIPTPVGEGNISLPRTDVYVYMYVYVCMNDVGIPTWLAKHGMYVCMHVYMYDV